MKITKKERKPDELKNKVIQEFINKKFKSIITLTYPVECYPKEEVTIKKQVAIFNERVRKLDPQGSYFYIYEIHNENNRLHVHMLSTIEDSKILFKLKNSWLKILKTSHINALNFKPITPADLEVRCSYVLKTVGNEEVERNLQIRLDTKRILGSSADLQLLIKEIRCKIQLPINFYEISPESNLENIAESLYKKYREKNIDIELVKTQLILELNSYTDVLDLLHYQNLEKFLSIGKSKISKGYLKFYNFIKEICAKEMSSAEILLKNWYIEKSRKTDLIEKIASILNLKDGDNFSENEILLRVCLDYLIKSCLRNTVMSIITYNLGKLAVKQSKFQSEIKEEDYRKLGTSLYLIIKNIYRDKLNFHIVETQWIERESLSDELNSILDNMENLIEIHQKIEFSFNDEWFQQIQTDRRITKIEISKLIQFHSPMLVEPQDWIIPAELSKEYGSIETEMYDAGKINTGGTLLNNYYFKKPLQKNKNDGHAHQLAISKACITTINKLQKIAFIVNIDQLEFLNKYKKYIPDHLTTSKKIELQLLKKQKRKVIKELYEKVEQDRREGKKNETDFARIAELRNDIEDCTSKLSKHELFNRVLAGFNELKEYKEHYYSYDLDFRMRLYPQQNELSPQGSKLARSLICFKEQTKFNEHEFKLYAARLHAKSYIFKEEDLIFHYNNYVVPLFKKFINHEEEAIQLIFKWEIPEPYLFISACLEYKKYKELESKNEKYYTGFPLILDCSGSGPQIMSLLFLIETFADFLNLKPNKEGIRHDYYVSIISQFLYNYKPKNRVSKDNVNIRAININWTYLKSDISEEDKTKFLIILRSICKNNIMTQLYGISNLKFRRQLESGLIKEKEKIIKYLVDDIIYEKFIKDFIDEFWYFQRSLPIYRLREFFQTLIRHLKEKNGALQWSTFDLAKISIKYQKYKKKKLDFKDQILGRLQLNFRETTRETDYTKIRNSAQANFIHSLDAAVNMYILTKFNNSIFPIHDAWGVLPGQSSELRKLVSEIYLKIAENNTVLQKCIDEFVTLLTETVSKTAGEAFKNYCEKTISIGNYDPSVLSDCKFMVYY